MNRNLQKEVGFWVDALIKWQPDMSISGLFDFSNIAKSQWIDVYKKTILELRANRYDGLANTLETRFEVFQKDVTEREKKRYAKDDDQPVFDQILSEYKITKPAYARSSDIYLAVMHIALSKQHLIDVLKKIAQLPETASGGGKARGEKKLKDRTPLEGEWSKPMTKSRMRKALGIDSEQTFNTFAKKYGIRQAGNRQTWQIRLDTLDGKTRSKLEKV